MVSYRLGVGAIVLVVTGCMAPATPTQRLTEAARELNESTWFGRMDLAASHATAAAREHFLARRSDWGKDIRILDMSLAGMELVSEGQRAVINVDVAWTRMDESSLRATRVAQVWSQQDGGWKLTRERRVAGDVGLFGEHVEVLHPPSPDVHFASRTIR
jgi:hypothetical protein